MSDAVAIVGMACRFGDARSPDELWQTVLSGRRAFRAIPEGRLRLSDYGSDAPHAPDHTYVREAAVLDGWSFDRVAFHVSGDVVRATDAAHWLALEVAREALDDAGFPDGTGLPRETTGVLVGNSLTGEFSRANLMRLRWPFVRRMVDAALAQEQWPGARRRAFLSRLETSYKAPFPVPGPESLAGALSNTIAGRICNVFDLAGGGYTVDGACASSLLAVATACRALVDREIDVAIAGGVDLSLDPFELVGFARVGALSRRDMRVYDQRSDGFLPGEGCGMVVLMRDADAVAAGRPRRAVIRGWGISSDGSGGLTRPEVAGQLLALRRAYARAGVGIDTVGYFEGHGTGTPVGDATELAALSRARRAAAAGGAIPAAIGSVKANIGHTKAAAGVAGLIKATLAVEAQVIPPTTGCVEPHAALRADDAALRAPAQAGAWPAGVAVRAGVSAMGFGGINVHVVLDGARARREGPLTERERALLATPQDAELFVVAGADAASLARQLDRLRRAASHASRAELTDVAAALARGLKRGRHRAAIVASSPAGLLEKLDLVRADGGAPAGRADEPARATRDAALSGIFIGRADAPATIGFLFPGQGSAAHRDSPALRARYPAIDGLYRLLADLLPPAESDDDTATAVAQPAIVAASLSALHVLASVGIAADVAVGHSLGELTALHWAGVMPAEAVLRLAAARGRIMGALRSVPGAMASIAADPDEVRDLLRDSSAVIAAVNAPRRTVVAGETRAVDAVAVSARARGRAAQRLAVSHAFHSPLMTAAEAPLGEYLDGETFAPMRSRVVSTVLGRTVHADDDLRLLLRRQLTHPVRFSEAFAQADDGVALWIEVGPGTVLQGLAGTMTAAPVVATDVGAGSWVGLLHAIGAAHIAGCDVDVSALFDRRVVRPYDLDASPHFLLNPCELAPPSAAADPSPGDVAIPDTDAPAADVAVPSADPGTATDASIGESPAIAAAPAESALAVVRRLVAETAELPIDVVAGEQSLLRDLHLSSIAVAQLAAEAARRLGAAPSLDPTEFSLSTVAQLAGALAARPARTDAPSAQTVVPGVDVWVRPFVGRRVPRPLGREIPTRERGEWRILSTDDHGIARTLHETMASEPGAGLIVCLSPPHDMRQVSLLLAAAREVLAPGGMRRLCIVEHEAGAAAFARSLYEESRDATVCVLDIPAGHPRLGALIAAELRAAEGFVEAHYDAAGARYETVLEPLELPPGIGAPTLGVDDVVLASGGASGITAECVLSLARHTGARLVLLGRSPESAPAVRAALESFAACGVGATYVSADVADAAATRDAVGRAEERVGPITAIVHGAGVNEPRLLSELDEAGVQRTLAPKVDGLANLVAAVDAGRLRLLVGLGSTIGRRGLLGAASYALANEWMAVGVERLQRLLPACRCVAFESSVWSAVGIGARSGQLDAMARGGIMPIAPAHGAELFMRLLASAALPAVRVVATGRYGSGVASTLEFARPPLRPQRFLEHVRVHYDRVELVAEADLSVDSDPYLADHVLEGRRLFPAVMGLEAMAQVASAVTGEPVRAFENATFDRSIVVPPHGSLRIRIAALVREAGVVDVVIRSAETAFEADHFRARCRTADSLGAGIDEAGKADQPACEAAAPTRVPADACYETAFFQRGRFRRIAEYTALHATRCVARIEPGGAEPWFGSFHPGETVLGDAGARDAAIHAVQACHPGATLVPVAVRRIVVGRPVNGACLTVHAVERRHERANGRDVLTYDLDVRDEARAPVERWENVTFRTVGAPRAPAIVPLLGPYVERRVAELVPWAAGALSVTVGPRAPVHRARRATRRARELGGVAAAIRERAASVAVSYSSTLAFAVSGAAVAACDVADVATRPDALWRDMLTPERFELATLLARDGREDRASAATRVWCAAECLTKAGLPPGAPLVLHATEPDGWTTFRAGTADVVTYAAVLRDAPAPLVFAMLLLRTDR